MVSKIQLAIAGVAGTFDQRVGKITRMLVIMILFHL